VVLVVVAVHAGPDAADDGAVPFGQPELADGVAVEGVLLLVEEVLHLVQQGKDVVGIVPVDAVGDLEEGIKLLLVLDWNYIQRHGTFPFGPLLRGGSEPGQDVHPGSELGSRPGRPGQGSPLVRRG